MLIKEPILTFARADLPFIVYCDASAGTTLVNGQSLAGGLGVVLTQKWEDGKERVISYASRKLHTHEKNYSAFLLEMLAVIFATKRFHTYLYGGKRFKVFSDHKPLSVLNKVQEKTHHRLADELRQFNYEIIYRKGEEQQAADFLSRNAIESAEEGDVRPPDFRNPIDQINDTINENARFMDLPPEEQSRLQMQDPICRFMKTKLEGDSESEMEEDDDLRFTKRFLASRLKNFKLDNHGVIWGQEGDKWLLYLPKDRQAEALRKAHDSDIRGTPRLEENVRTYQSSIFLDLNYFRHQKYIQNCEKCQRAKQPHSKASITAPLKPLEIPSRFNDRVHVDLMGPLRSNGYNKYVMVMSDAFTKWIELVPIPDKSAETIANAIMENWIYRNSAMEVLVSDNGKEFKNETMVDLCREMDIKHKFTSPYHPQSNAQCERQNRTILDYLRTTLDDNTLDWEKKIRACQFSYNTQVHNSTKYSPYYLRHLMNPTVPIRPTNDKDSCGETWTEEALQRLNNAWGEVRKNLTKASQSQKQQYDRHTTKRTFQVGDKVLVKNHKTGTNENRKLKNPWIGPYRIVDVVGETNIVIQKTEKGKKILIHTNEVKLFKETQNDYSPENEHPTGSNEEVELPDEDEPQPGTSQEATENTDEEETPRMFTRRSTSQRK